MKPAFKYCWIDLGWGHMNNPLLIMLIIFLCLAIIAMIAHIHHKFSTLVATNNDLRKQNEELKIKANKKWDEYCHLFDENHKLILQLEEIEELNKKLSVLNENQSQTIKKEWARRKETDKLLKKLKNEADEAWRLYCLSN